MPIPALMICFRNCSSSIPNSAHASELLHHSALNINCQFKTTENTNPVRFGGTKFVAPQFHLTDCKRENANWNHARLLPLWRPAGFRKIHGLDSRKLERRSVSARRRSRGSSSPSHPRGSHSALRTFVGSIYSVLFHLLFAIPASLGRRDSNFVDDEII